MPVILTFWFFQKQSRPINQSTRFWHVNCFDPQSGVKEKGKKIENFLERKSREKNLPRKSFWKKERKKEIEKKRMNYFKKNLSLLHTNSNHHHAIPTIFDSNIDCPPHRDSIHTTTGPWTLTRRPHPPTFMAVVTSFLP